MKREEKSPWTAKKSKPGPEKKTTADFSKKRRKL